MNQLLHTKLPIPVKVDAWLNSINHFSGNHDHCPFEHGRKCCEWRDGMAVPAIRERMHTFLKDTKDILEKCDGEFSTQINESLNRTKLKYAGKDVKWGGSWPARMACAILDRNKPFWKLDLYKHLKCRGLLPKIRKSVKLQAIARERVRLVIKNQQWYRNEKKRLQRKKELDAMAERRAKGVYAKKKIEYRTNPYRALDKTWFPEMRSTLEEAEKP
jgi:hypothetical protein